MCGFSGIFCFDQSRTIDRSVFVEQTNTLVHRGPDDGAVWFGSGVALGHRRLSIIDIGGGLQPMFDAEGRIGIVFNGEIYNYRELRKQLRQKGHRFQSDSDTETMLYAYREWGSSCVDHFDGMFAFAIYDRRKGSLFLARDRLGKKPLYYYKDDERIVFASEIKAIVADKSIPRKMNPSAVVDYFAYNYVPGPQTIFQDIRKLPAGHMMSVKKSGVCIRKYWDVDFSHQEYDRGIDHAAQELLEKLEEAVRFRLRSDVPLGAFLSGGIDSSLVVSLMAKGATKEVLTHTIGFEEQEYDERSYARETSEHFNTSHFEKIMKVDSTAVISDLSWYYDEPFGDSSAIPTYYLCKATKERVTVALSGDGGDENFAGYRRYRFAMAEDMFRKRLPSKLRKVVFGGLGHLYPKADYLPRYLRAKATLTNLSHDHERAYFLSLTQKSYPQFLHPDFLFGLVDYDPYVHFENHLPHANTKDALSRLQYIDLKMYLCDDILVKVDRASMAHALEVRVPMLDHRAVEFAARLPPEFKLDAQSSKRVLKRSARSILPPSIFDREKKGFTIPLPQWFRGGLKRRSESTFFDQPGGMSGLLSEKGLKRMWFEHQNGLRNHATSLWSVLMFEEWAGRYLHDKRDSPPKIDARPTQILK
jgi:asparagine synthase (glutamine-hydrolysing)